MVLQIIETPAGQRQLRYRVGPGGPGVERINALTDEIQAESGAVPLAVTLKDAV